MFAKGRHVWHISPLTQCFLILFSSQPSNKQRPNFCKLSPESSSQRSYMWVGTQSRDTEHWSWLCPGFVDVLGPHHGREQRCILNCKTLLSAVVASLSVCDNYPARRLNRVIYAKSEQRNFAAPLLRTLVWYYRWDCHLFQTDALALFSLFNKSRQMASKFTIVKNTSIRAWDMSQCFQQGEWPSSSG